MNKKPLKILQLSKFYPPFWGGIESVTYEITEGINKQDIHCDVLVANTRNMSVQETFPAGYTVWRAASFGRVFSTSLAPAIIRQLRKICNEYDIIHVHFPDPLNTLALLLVRPNAKIIIHWHSDIIKQTVLLRFFLPLQHALLRRADLIIGTSPKYIEESPQLKPYLYKTVAVPLGSTVQAPDDLNLLPKLKEEYKGKVVLFGLGRLVYYKGFEYLIRATALLPENFVVLIGGEGPLESELKKEIEEKQLGNRVKLLGKIPGGDLAAYFQLCDIFCFPSTHASEAFGVSQIEAMSFGKPVIATHIPRSGVDWVNMHGVSGLNVPFANPEAFAAAVINLYNNQDTYKKLSEGALNRYREWFTPEKMVDKVLACYQQALNVPSVIDKPIQEKPKVSIITVLLNSHKYIRDAIESVLSQKYDNIEYIVIDGGSTDGSIEIIQSYKDRISVFLSEPDKGMYDALNKGIALASGDIIGALNSDDFFENENVIADVVQAFVNSGCDAVYGDLLYISHQSREEVVRVWHAGPYNPVKFYRGWMPPHPTFYVRRELYQKLGSFDTQLRFAADYELMLRMILKHRVKLAYIPRFMIRMRVGGASNRSLTNRAIANLEDRKAWKLIGLKPGLFTLILKPLKKIFQYRLINRRYESN